MTTLNDYREERLRKLGELGERGVEAYPARSYRDTKIGEVLAGMGAGAEAGGAGVGDGVGVVKDGGAGVVRGGTGEVSGGGADIVEGDESSRGEMEGKVVTVAGRITAIRSFGKLVFIKIRDYTGEVQIFMRVVNNISPDEYSGTGVETGAGDEKGENISQGEYFDEDGARAGSGGNEEVGSAGGEGGNISQDEYSERKARKWREYENERFLTAKEVKLLDTGDFIEARGEVGRTQTGEISVFANKVRLLTKALRPLPGRDGLTNKEERYRRRYVDMNVNLEVRERMVRRSRFWQATREFMMGRGFIEINTPILEHTTGGADANPFVTHMDALDEDFYLRISHELPLKRLLGAGFERVFDIGARFRNEGIDDEHLPEHVAFESYAAYEDYEDGLELYEAMIKYVAKETWGTLKFRVGGVYRGSGGFGAGTSGDVVGSGAGGVGASGGVRGLGDGGLTGVGGLVDGVWGGASEGGMEIDLDCKWPRVKYADLIREKYGVDVFKPELEELRKIVAEEFEAGAFGVDAGEKAARERLKRELLTKASAARLIDYLWKFIRRTSAGPYWLVEEPLSLSPLAKVMPGNPLVTQRFHPIIAGTEMGNGYSELNDPLDQLRRFEEQQAMRDAGDAEAQMLDRDFVEMLEYGMPPACGWGNSERNFWLLEGVTGREGTPFPLLKASN